MSWTVLAPASAVVTALGLLAWMMHRLDAETRALRASLRRSRATAVATEELSRASAKVARDAVRIDQVARTRRDLRRARRRRARR